MPCDCALWRRATSASGSRWRRNPRPSRSRNHRRKIEAPADTLPGLLHVAYRRGAGRDATLPDIYERTRAAQAGPQAETGAFRDPTPCRSPRRAGMNGRGGPGLVRRAGHRQRSRGSRAKAMGQTVREKALIRQAREDGRPSEDDVAQERLGWRGQKGRPGSATMTQDGKLQTPSHLDPGHTA